MSTEIWRGVAGYEGLYQVSNFGRVKSFHKGERILKPNQLEQGYLLVRLYHSGESRYVLVHRLVAEAFIPNPGGKPEVNHINGDKTDNHVENLEWATRTENVQHAFATGLTKQNGEDNSCAKLTNEQARFIRENPDGLTCTELARMFGVGKTTISKIQRGTRYRNAGGRIREPKVRYTPDDVQNEIRRLYVYDSHEFGLNALAKRFGVTPTTIRRIIHET